MALLDSEITRIKFELGWNLLNTGALPYVGTTAYFEQILQPYTLSGAATTSTTGVIGDGTPRAITLGDDTGFASGCRVVVDVDGRQETLTVQSLSGTTLTAHFAKTHSGTYPVTVEGGETIIRQSLAAIWEARVTRGKSQGRGNLKAIVGDVEWFDTGESAFAASSKEIDLLRDELAAACGDISLNLWRKMKAAGQRLSVY